MSYLKPHQNILRSFRREDKVRYFDYNQNDFTYGEIEDRNGSLAYVRDENGVAEWVDVQHLEWKD